MAFDPKSDKTKLGLAKRDEALPESKKVTSPILSAFLEQQSPLKIFISRFIRKPQDIDDIAQETFIRAFKAEKKREIEHPKAYIYRVARNLALEVLSKRSTRFTDFIEDSCSDSLLVSDDDVEKRVGVLEKMDKVNVAIAELPPQCQRVFIMHKVYGFKYREIAQQLGISVSTVEKHIMMGLKRCKDSVKAQENPDSVVNMYNAKVDRQ